MFGKVNEPKDRHPYTITPKSYIISDTDVPDEGNGEIKDPEPAVLK